jgi:hypothetical protein
VVQAVREGRLLPAAGWDGAWAVALCHAAQQSVQTGMPVALADFQPRGRCV